MNTNDWQTINTRFKIAFLPKVIMTTIFGAALSVLLLDGLGIFTHRYLTVPLLLMGVISVSVLMSPKLPIWIKKYQYGHLNGANNTNEDNE